jgi:hypothetical protein
MVVRDAPARTRLRVIHPDEGSLAELGLKHLHVTGGDLGGAQVTTIDDGGAMSVRFRLHPADEQGPGKLTFSATLHDIRGRPVGEVAPAVRLMALCRPPHKMQWLEEFGSGVLATHPFVEDVTFVAEGLLQLVENLAVIQDHVRGTVVVPQEIDEDTIRCVAEAAHLVRGGELRGTWTEWEVPLNEGVVRADFISSISGAGTLVLESSSLMLELDSRTYDLGPLIRSSPRYNPR